MSKRAQLLLKQGVKENAAKPPVQPKRKKPPSDGAAAPDAGRSKQRIPMTIGDAGATSEAARAALDRVAAAAAAATDLVGADADDGWAARVEDSGDLGGDMRPPEAGLRRAMAPRAFYGVVAGEEATKVAARGGAEPDGGADGAEALLDDRFSRRLRPHQLEGIRWICARLRQSRGCILADEMGLGKTATALGVLAVHLGVDGCAFSAAARARRCIVACPAGLAPNWIRETKLWLKPTDRAAARAAGGGAPHLSVFSGVGAAGFDARCRKRRMRLMHRVDGDDDETDAIGRFERCPLEHKPVLVISYESYRENAARLNGLLDVGLLVCDEAHRLKGGDATQLAAAIAASPAQKRLLVTATPLQNGLGELRQLLSLCGQVDGAAAKGDDAFGEDLKAALRASTLRRSLDDCEQLKASLPQKADSLVVLKAGARHRAAHFAQMSDGADKKQAAWGLRAVATARLLCSSPCSDAALDLDHCPKWLLIASLLDGLRRQSRGERVVVVSQYSKVLDAGVELCRRRGWPCARLDGRASPDEREDIVQRINAPAAADAPFVTLLSIRAGGVGLTLTGASRLVLFEPSWNPAEDEQAVARVWRDGQKRPVHIYRLATQRSVEEKMLLRQVRKSALADRVKQCQIDALLDDAAGGGEGGDDDGDDGGGDDAPSTGGAPSRAEAPNLAELVSLGDAGPGCELAARDASATADEAAVYHGGASQEALSYDAALRAAAKHTSDVVYVRARFSNVAAAPPLEASFSL
ncbi:P-loop containing nucleoside triphosphate hydrolase protein [Pelagophyceae sp. CCMP2097]|nr:P-loop containing nucleoside triphosphate hydrolase protein [Pelagophyceae sp. CCMP2097]|mmetsp:Transcript_23604/g.80622  ORF Transcript_23604/g.80622 Transcript_23604/m.80622 type:complete len:754 (-) Transcript_23604:26-2287(-)